MSNKNLLLSAGSGDAIPAGAVGQIIQSEVSAQNMVAGSTAGITSITLPPGIWLVNANAVPIVNTSNSTAFSLLISDVGTTSNSLTGFGVNVTDRGGSAIYAITTSLVYTVTTSKTFYMNGYFNGSTGTPQARGLLQATRIA